VADVEQVKSSGTGKTLQVGGNVQKIAKGRRFGEDHQNAVLTNNEVEQLRKCRDGGMTWDQLTEKFEIPKRTVRDICNYHRR
jgi:predicted DNA-binding protein (UPF0251 family)